MRRAWPILTMLAACSFDPHSSQSTPQDGSGPLPAQQDAPASTPADAPVKHDAAPTPADACIDSDDDGVCDSIEWPCGALPTLPGPEITMQTNQSGSNYLTTFILSNINIDSTNQRVVAAPGARVSVKLHYDITDTACPDSCRDQIEIGWVAGTRSGCVFDDGVSKQKGAAGNLASGTTITVPTTPGEYDLRTNIGQNNACDDSGGDANGWWGSDPGSNDTIAKVCVH
ncbi:MAG TPA: hypothetical protein VGL61_05820 [Kofleriaceae bacterium]|jgi:hypothetical protein